MTSWPFQSWRSILTHLQQTTFEHCDNEQFLLLPQCFNFFPIITISLIKNFHMLMWLFSKSSAAACFKQLTYYITYKTLSIDNWIFYRSFCRWACRCWENVGKYRLPCLWYPRHQRRSVNDRVGARWLFQSGNSM